MKGVSSLVVSTLLLLVSLASVTILYTQFGNISSEATSRASQQLVDARMSPKLLAVSCLGNYGYAQVSTDEPLQGGLYYTIKYGSEEVADGFTTANITDVGRIYFNASMTDGNDYTVLLRSKHWTLHEHCISHRDPSRILFIPFNESSGSAAADYSGNGNDAWLNASWVNGTSDHALRFDGVDQYARVNSTGGFSSREFTLAFWALREEADADDEGVVEGGSFRARSMASGDLQFSLSGGSSLASSLENDIWRHFTMKYDGSELRLYRNCSLVGSTSSSYSPSPGDLLIGKGTVAHFQGSVDEVYFFSRALDDEEIPMFCGPLQDVQDDAYNGTWSEGGLFI